MNRLYFRKFTIAVLVLAFLGILSACENAPASSMQITQPPKTNVSNVFMEETDGANTTNETVTQSEANNILITYFAVAENSEVDAISSASVRIIDGEAK